jgi:hypothetical protein
MGWPREDGPFMGTSNSVIIFILLIYEIRRTEKQ